MKVWLKPANYERRYKRFLLNLITEFKREVFNQIAIVEITKSIDNNVKTDSDKVNLIVAALLLWWFNRKQTLYLNILGYFQIVNKFNDMQFRGVVKSLTGLSLPNTMSAGYVSGSLVSQVQDIINKLGPNVDIYREEKYLPGIETNWKTIQETYIDKTIKESISNIELFIRNQLATTIGRSLIIGGIEKLLETVTTRVGNFSKDQINSLDTQLTRERQLSIGAIDYVWDTQKDERVRGNPDGLYPNSRPSHYARQGLIFSWNNPPEGGAPGEATGCRCFARMRLYK